MRIFVFLENDSYGAEIKELTQFFLLKNKILANKKDRLQVYISS